MATLKFISPTTYTMDAMRNPNEYLVIQAWGEMMCSAPSHILADQENAAVANAPTDSIYFVNKEWVRLSDITNPDARRRIEQRLVELRRQSAIQ